MGMPRLESCFVNTLARRLYAKALLSYQNLTCTGTPPGTARHYYPRSEAEWEGKCVLAPAGGV